MFPLELRTPPQFLPCDVVCFDHIVKLPVIQKSKDYKVPATLTTITKNVPNTSMPVQRNEYIWNMRSYLFISSTDARPESTVKFRCNRTSNT